MSNEPTYMDCWNFIAPLIPEARVSHWQPLPEPPKEEQNETD
jgi:hypothetical protein